MQQNYQTSKYPTAASTADSGHATPAAVWANPSRITADDGSYATWGAYNPGQGSTITGSSYGFNLPPGAAIDGIGVYVDGSQVGCYGSVSINVAGTTSKGIGGLGTTYGGSSDLWGASSISRTQAAAITASVDVSDISGGDGFAQIDVIQIIIYWHIDPKVAPADVPTRVAYKVYSRAGKYLGDLPNVQSPFGFSQDMNSAGSTITVNCATSIQDGVTVQDVQSEDGNTVQSEDGSNVQGTKTSILITTGASADEALYKNSNRLVVILYNRWYPNGKVMFSGQVNRLGYKYGAGSGAVSMLVYSDGADMANYIARGYPFAYTNDVSQTAQDGYVTISEGGEKFAGWQRYGQSFTVGGSAMNTGAIALLVQGSATVTITLYDAPNGNVLGSVTQNVADGTPTVEQFQFPQLIDATPGATRFFGISLGQGQSLNVYRNSSSVYSGGAMYDSNYGGGSGGGSYTPTSSDLYFVEKYGTPTTTAVYTGADPVTGIMAGVLADYNSRGGLIKKRKFVASGISINFKFVMATVTDVQKQALELAPNGYYSYVDLGNATMDMLPASTTADFTVTRGRDINELDLDLSIENVKNYLLLTGGETSPGVNLFIEYPDPVSAALYGPRYVPKTVTGVLDTPTANAVGESFIAENSKETQETTLTVLNTAMDITLLNPGKTIGFRNFGTFIDQMVLQIVRREYTTGSVRLTLGRLPLTLSAEIQRINRELQNQQTVNNPNQPS